MFVRGITNGSPTQQSPALANNCYVKFDPLDSTTEKTSRTIVTIVKIAAHEPGKTKARSKFPCLPFHHKFPQRRLSLLASPVRDSG